MSDADNGMLEEVQRMIEAGMIPPKVTLRLLWSGLVVRSRQEGRIVSRLVKVERKITLTALTASAALAVAVLIAELHLRLGG